LSDSSKRLRENTISLQRAKDTCVHCSLGQFCLPQGLHPKEMEELDDIVEHSPTMEGGKHLFRAGDEFRSLYAVRSGSYKTYALTQEGEEQVLGFHLPGELVGLDAIYPGRHPSSAVALDTSSVCMLPYAQLSDLASKIPSLQHQVFKLLSKNITQSHALAGDLTAEERLASFLVGLSRRNEQRGYSAARFRLAMPRRDMGNYLRLATETVSRVFRRFQDEELIRVDRREIEVLDEKRLAELAKCPEV
jgi:CRP/FNR family transcriptional regulator, anaerobic regulatory protein